MSKVIYLAGHGRVSTDTTLILHRNVTMHWLGHLGDVSNGISYAFLNGTLTAEIGTSGPLSPVPEHYLCGENADSDSVADTKIANFFQRTVANPLGDPDPYVLYPRGKHNVSLTSICNFLQVLSPSEDWHLYWTCCRGYIGVRNPMTSAYNKTTGLVEQKLRVDPERTRELHEQNHKTVNANWDTIRLVARSDEAVLRHGSVEGLSKKKQKFASRGFTEVIENFLVKLNV